MAKRKCVRRAVIELSDSEDETDDCMIVESYHADNASNNENTRTSDVYDDNSQVQTSRVKVNRRKVESHVASNKKKEGQSVRPESDITSKRVKKNLPVARARKRKKSCDSREDTKMGLGCSKTKVSEAKRLRESVIFGQRETTRIQAQQQRQNASAGPVLKKDLEDAQRSDKLQEKQETKEQISYKPQLQGQMFSQQQQQQLLQENAAGPNIRPLIFGKSEPAIMPEKTRIFAGKTVSPEYKPHETRAFETRKFSPEPESHETMHNIAPTNVSPDSKPKSNDTAETYLARLAESNVRCVEWTDIDYVQESHSLSRFVAENIVKLLKEDNTIPFIARYRKNMTMGMDADELRNVKNSWDRAKLMKQKANAIIKEIDKQGKWTAEFHAFVHGTKSLNDLEQIQSMFKVTKSTLAERAREVGLDKPAKAIMSAEKIEPLEYLVDPRTEGLKSEEQVRDGIVCILADMINKSESTFETLKLLRNEHTMSVETSKARGAEKMEKEAKNKKQKNDETKFDLYHKFSSLESNLKPHQILAINRGESRKIISVKINIPTQFEQAFKLYCSRQYAHACRVSPLHRNLLTAAFDHLWSKSIKSAISRRTRHELNERAEIASMDVFAENVKQLLLTPPIRGKVVVGVDPGFRHGCKLAVVSEQGDVLETAKMYPHEANNPKAKKDAERILSRLVCQYGCTTLALGNGTACRETEVFLAELIKKRAFEPLNVVYTIVDETGASIYSCSREATTEFPDLDVNLVSAVSIARRLQDPMAELVKIEPKHLGVGMYQHDLPEKQLAAKLNEVIMEAVSFVGVDVNTASVSLLKRVAGLGDSRAKHIIDYRKSSGPFRTRNDLMKVPRIGNKTFEQCAGFIRIMPETAAIGNDHKSKQTSLNYLDQTWIHPESYDIAKKFINAAKCDLSQLGTKSFIYAVKLFANQDYSGLANKFNTTVETMRIIVEGLSMEKGQDIRAKADVSMFRKSLTCFDDLKIGTVLTGVVRNNTHFGAFVDVGVERAGLIHKSQMGGMTLSVGQRVETKVNNVEKDRGRLGLTLIKCF